MEKLTIENIITLQDEKCYAKLKEILTEMNSTDIAELFFDLPSSRHAVLFRLIPKDEAAEVFAYLDPTTQENLIMGFSDSELSFIISDMYLDDTVDLVDEMPANVVKRILKLAKPETRNEINHLLRYPEDSAGAIMTTEFIALRPDMTVSKALEKIRRVGPDSETIYTMYVTTNARVLIGLVTGRELLLSDEDALISDIMEDNVISAKTTDDKEHVANIIRDYGFYALPIVDKDNRLVGIVTVDDAIDVITEEVEKDISKMAAIVPLENAYLKTSVLKIWKSRIVWLLILMISATFTGLVLASFENIVTAIPVLIAFIPMLMNTGGNAGSQSAVTIIRALSMGEVTTRDYLKVISKEARVALFCGLTLAAANFVKIFLFDNLLMGYFDTSKFSTETFLTIGIVCLTLFITVMTAKIVGSLLPLFAYKVGADPAVMASPLISTIVDATSMLIYVLMAKLFLPGI